MRWTKIFYGLLPKRTRLELGEYRIRVLERCDRDPTFAALVRDICRVDFLFFANVFLFIEEKRSSQSSVNSIPFCTYRFQDDDFLKMLDCLGVRDICVKKSRDQGATWMILALLLWLCLLHDDRKVLLMSWKEDCVDNRGDPDALMPKLDHMINLLPGFLRPRLDRRSLHIGFLDTRSVITGCSTTAEAGRSGRNTVAFMDEFGFFGVGRDRMAYAALQKNTPCRIMVSTAGGTQTAHSQVMNKEDWPGLKLWMHWSRHPVQRRGLYRNGPRGLEILDRSYVFPSGYRFVADGRLRSPYYDQEESRSISPHEVLRELDMDDGGVSGLFDGAILDRLIEKHGRVPDRIIPIRDFLNNRGIRLAGNEEVEARIWVRAGDAQIWWWYPSDLDSEPVDPPADTVYAMGVDISAGNGSSNSAICIWDAVRRTKVCQAVNNRIQPMQWADLAVALARWFSGSDRLGAYMIWEHEGHGISFGQHVMDLDYRNIYRQQNEETYGRKMSDRPGWSPTQRNKQEVMDRYRDALYTESAVNPCRMSLDECREFIYDGSGFIRHTLEMAASDNSARRRFHGDVVVADSLAWFLVDKHIIIRSKAVDSEAGKYPYGSYGWRLEEARKRREIAGRGFWQRKMVLSA